MSRLVLPVFLLFSSAVLEGATVSEETLAAWKTYQERTEARIEKELSSESGFLVRDFLDARLRQEILSEYRGGVYVRALVTRNQEGGTIAIPNGLVHHWYGTTFIPGATVPEVLAWVQDYDRHQDYFEEVEDSRLVSREGEIFEIFLRLRRKKVLTVHYNSDHEVTYRNLGSGRAASRSIATRIAELDNPGTNREREKPFGEDRGFLWKLNSYWRFSAEDGGVAIECESISLSRTIPLAAKLIVQPFINEVPRESLEAALLPMRKALARSNASAKRPAPSER